MKSKRARIVVVSDPHYACDLEKERVDYELRPIDNPLLRLLVKAYRRFVWNRDPFGKNNLVERALAGAGSVDGIVANGDYTVDSEFVGVSDPASKESARQCLSLLRNASAPWFRAVIGDHDLGKKSLFGGKGGMRLASLACMERELDAPAFWETNLGAYRLIGVTSSLIALPVYQADAREEELAGWRQRRSEHLDRIGGALEAIPNGEKAVLFCHDPTALPFLWDDRRIRGRLDKVQLTVLGHLHSPSIFRLSRRLAGFPEIRFLGLTIRRMSRALNRGRHWAAFHPVLCPALAGIECLQDGGYLILELDPEGAVPPVIHVQRMEP